MPYTLKPNKIYAKDPNSNNYLPQNVITDQSTAEEVAAIEAKGAETLASSPDDYTSLSNQVGDIGNALNYEGDIVNDINGRMYIAPDSWEIGGINFASTGFTYGANNKRVRTKQNFYQ